MRVTKQQSPSKSREEVNYTAKVLKSYMAYTVYAQHVSKIIIVLATLAE